jgi:predicted ATPase
MRECDVFVSHSSKDRDAADAVCAAIEAAGVKCWIAPRDIRYGEKWAKAIMRGINQCRVMVLVFSGNANGSSQIPREVERAANRHMPIAAIRIEERSLNQELEYFLSSGHWMEAHVPPLEQHLEQFANQVRALVEAETAGARQPPEPATQPPATSASAGAALPSRVPAQAARRSTRNNLPVSPTRFIGRSADLHEIGERFAGFRLVTLTGPGGCGKTRLALEYARLAADSFPDGVWFVRLAGVNDPAHVVVESLRAAKIPEPAGAPEAAMLADALAEKRCLLLLDNCEHVIDAAADLAAAILAGAPDCQVLATSRIRLSVTGESILSVEALTLPREGARTAAAIGKCDAVALFVERVRAYNPAFKLTNVVAPTVVRICRAVDGLPLAVELICARLKSMPIEALVKRLDEVLPLLQGAPRDAATRHKTMQAAIAWSVDSLAAEARSLFYRLGVFSGGWSLEATESICADPEANLPASEMLTLLEQLCESSLVVLRGSEIGEPSRYRFYEPLRQFAEAELKNKPHEAALRDRHAGYFLAMAQSDELRLASAEQKLALEELEAEHKNLQAAISWYCSAERLTVERSINGLRLAAYLWHFWDLRGYFTIGRSILSRALAAATTPAGECDPAAGETSADHCAFRAKALNSAGYLAFRQGDYAQGKAMSTEALAIRRALRQPLLEARCLHNLGNIAGAAGDFPQAIRDYEQALELYRAGGDRVWEAGVLGRIAEVLLWENRLNEAFDFAQQACALNHAVGNLAWAALDLHVLGEIHRARGELPEACMQYCQALKIRLDLGEKARIAVTLVTIAEVAIASTPDLAARLLAATQQLREEIDTPLQAGERQRFESQVRRLTAELSAPHFARQWDAGSEEPWENAVEAALQWLAQAERPS